MTSSEFVEKVGLKQSVSGTKTSENRDEFGAQKTFGFWGKHAVAIKIFITCWLIFAIHFATNTVREIYPALSLADNLSFDVLEYEGLHPDIFVIEERGTFINNNPGASILGAIPYFLWRPVTDRIIEHTQKTRAANPLIKEADYESIYPMAREFHRKAREKGFDVKFGLAAAIMQSFLMAPLAALSAVVMFWLLRYLTKNERTAILLALLYAFATPIFYRTAQLNQNVLLAHFALFSFAMLWRPWKIAKPLYFSAGLCAGWTLVLDYSGLVTLLSLSGYAVARWFSSTKEERKISSLARFGAGVLICVAVLLIYQWSCFGNPFFPAQTYMPPANFTEQGYRGFSFPQMDLFWETAFSIRYGLFISAPILGLVFLVPFWAGKKHRLLEKRELVFIVGITLLFFMFCAANQYGRMQFNTGVRHIVPVVPVLFLLTANVLLNMPKVFAVLLGIGATYWSWCLAMYRDVEQGAGIFEAIRHISLEGLRLPWLSTLEKMGYVQGNLAVPVILMCFGFIWLLWKFELPKMRRSF